jgi:RNA polymerase sigma factor (sigma-70 family)
MSQNDFDVLLHKEPPVKFNELYNELHRQLLYFAVVKVGAKEEDAPDIVANAFIKFVKFAREKGPFCNDKKHLKRTLYVIVKRCCIDFFRTGKHTEALNEEMLKEQIDENTIEQIKDQDELEETLHVQIAKLPEGQRTIVKMFYFQKLSYAQISARLNIAVNTVKNQLQNARDNLRNFPGWPLILLLLSVVTGGH